MSTTMNDVARTSQEQFLATIRQGQEAYVEGVAAWAKAVHGLIPSPPPMPGTEDLPKPQALVENAFDFAQQLFDAQRDFARKVVAAAAPVLERAQPTDAS